MSTTTDTEGLAFLQDAPPLRRRGARWRLQTLQLGLRLTELAVLFLVGAGVAACVPSLGGISPSWSLLAAGIGTAAAFEVARARRSARSRAALLVLQVLAATVSGTLVLLLAGGSWRADLAWGACELIGTTVLLAIIHQIYLSATEALLAAGRMATHVAVVGSGPLAKLMQAQLETGDRLAVKVVGRYHADDLPSDPTGARGTLRTLLSDCRLEFVDAIVLAPEPGDPEAAASLHRSLRACTQEIYLAGELAEALPIIRLGVTPVALLARRPITSGGAFAKRTFDVAGALLLLAFMAPLLGLLALAIRLDSPGPILFRQLRVGYNNRLFYILKFRSMRQDAADRLAKQQTVHGDTRVTRVGRIIRRLSLDELPQLLNVLRGEMSLVGPRPHAPGTSIGGQRVHLLADDYARRHLVRPGITGLAQVRGFRGGLQDRRQLAQRLAADLEYIERWSVWLDIRILLGTVLLEVRKSRGC